MTNAIFRVPDPTNETVKNYIPNSEEAKKLILAYRKMYAEKIDIPLYVGDEEIRTGNTQPCIRHTITTTLWENTTWQVRKKLI